MGFHYWQTLSQIRCHILHLIWVYTVYSSLSVQILRVNMESMWLHLAEIFWISDLYNDWLAPRFRQTLLVETWQNGRSKLCSNCTGTYKVNLFIITLLTLLILKMLLIHVMLNKLRCQAYFIFSANQITWYKLLIQIHILIDKQCRSETNWSGSTLFAKIGHIRVQQDKG